MKCVNKSLPEYKELVKAYGDQLAEAFVISYSQGSEDFIYPKVGEVLPWLKETKQSQVGEAINSSSPLEVLKGIVNSDGDIITTGVEVVDKINLSAARSLVKQGEGFTIKTIDGVKKLIVKESDNMFQLEATTIKADKQLNDRMVEFLKPLGVTVEILDNLKERTGVDAVGAVDIINKIILISQGKQDISTLPEETAHFFVEMMGNQHPHLKAMMHKITQWEGYQAIYDEYVDVYRGNEYKIRKEAIGKLIAKYIVDHKDAPKSMIEHIKAMIKDLLNLFNKYDIPLSDLAEDVALDILSRDYSKIKRKMPSGSKLTDYESSIERDAEARSIVDSLRAKGFMLTGSLSLRKQGTVYRTSDEDIHDLDFKVPYSLRDTWEDEVKSLFGELDVNLEIVKTDAGRYTKAFQIGKFNVDFFVDDDIFIPSEDGFSQWQDIFMAKLSPHSRDFGRDKDLRDFLTFTPNKKSRGFENKDGVFFQLSVSDEHRLDKLKVILQDRFTQLKYRDTKDKAKREAQLKEQMEILKGVDMAKEIAQVIDGFYNEALGGEENWSTKMNALVAETTAYLDSGKNDPKVIKKYLDKFDSYNHYSHYLELLDEYRDAYKTTILEDVNPEEGSALDKLAKLDNARKSFQKNYTEVTRRLMSKRLAPFINQDINAQAEVEYKAKKKIQETRLANTKDLKERANIKKKLEKIERDYKVHVLNEESLLDQMISIDRDPSMLDSETTPIINSGDSVLSLFAKMVKSAFTELQDSLNIFGRDLAKNHQEFKASSGRNDSKPSDFYKGMYTLVSSFKKVDNEIVETKEYQFTQEIDYNAYNQAVNSMYAEYNGLVEAKEQKKADKLKKDFFTENTEPLPMEGKVVYTNSSGESYKEDGIKDIVEREAKKVGNGYITEEAFYHWIAKIMFEKNIRMGFLTNGQVSASDNVDYGKALYDSFLANPNSVSFTKELVRPKLAKFRSAEYEQLSKDVVAYEYYKKLLGSYMISQQSLPEYARTGINLPYIPRKKRDYIMDGQVMKALKAGKDEAFNITVRDAGEYNSADQVEDILDRKLIPIHFKNPIPADEVSLDIFESVLSYEKMTKSYHMRSSLEGEASATLNLVKEREVYKEDSQGNNVLLRAARTLDKEFFKGKDGESRAEAWLDSFINMTLYDERKAKEEYEVPVLGTIDAGKLTDTAMSFASMASLGGPELLKSLGNNLQARIQLNIEAASKQFISRKDLLYGEAEFVKSISGVLSDMTKPFPETLEGQMIDHFNFIQGEFLDEFGRTQSGSALKKLSTSGAWMFANNIAEFETQVKTGFALMNTVKLKLNGKDINLKQAYEVKDGLMVLKEGVTKPDGSEFSLKDREDFMNRLHALNKGMHGVYNSFDRVKAKKWAIFRLMFMFKNFLPTTLKKRFKSMGRDEELGSLTEGFYVTFARTLRYQGQEMVNFLLKKENELTELQKANITRAIREISFALILSALAAVLASMGDDDKELKKNYAYNLVLYELMRTSSEVRFYLPVVGFKDQGRMVLGTPSAISTHYKRLGDFTSQLIWFGEDGMNFNDTYKVNPQGWAEKGELKLKIKALKLLGFTGDNLNPDNAAKIFTKQ